MTTSDIDWRHFVAYAVCPAVSFVWIQARRRRDRKLTVVGVVGMIDFFAAL